MQEVDHDKRRQKIAEIAVRVIADEGLDAATVRNIAAKAGYSTTIITHYFNNKDELLLLAYRHISRESRERMNAIIARDPADVLGALLSMTALEQESLQGWRVYIAFWQKAGHDPEFAGEQQKGINQALEQLERVLRARLGDDRPDSPTLARRLIALVQGIAIQQLFDPECWSIEELKATLIREVELLDSAR